MPTIFIRPQVTRFVILFVERSGSTYLATLLGEHPHILARREEFAHMRQRGMGGSDQLNWVRQFFSPPIIGKHKAIGFKTKMVDILDRDSFARLLQDFRCHIIMLQRRNLVKAVISTVNAKRLHEASGNWNLLEESDRMPSFRVDLERFDQMLLERRVWDRDIEDYINRLKLPTLSLLYEDMLLDETAFMRRVFDFIGVKYTPVKGKTIKNTNDNLREAVLNFDELRRKYVGTDYEDMFDEVLI